MTPTLSYNNGRFQLTTNVDEFEKVFAILDIELPSEPSEPTMYRFFCFDLNKRYPTPTELVTSERYKEVLKKVYLLNPTTVIHNWDIAIPNHEHPHFVAAFERCQEMITHWESLIALKLFIPSHFSFNTSNVFLGEDLEGNCVYS